MRRHSGLFLLFWVAFLSPMRGPSYPFISGDTFRDYCKHVFDETTKGIIPSHIKDGDTIFLKADAPYVQDFFNNYYHIIDASFILVSHNGDHSIPGLKTSMDNPPDNFNVLDYLNNPDTKIIMWFAQNVDEPHNKLYPIPIGLANKRWRHGNVNHFRKAIESFVHWENKKTSIYLNFDVGTNRAVREPIFNYFSQKSFCTNDRKRSHQEYLFEMKKYKYILCPPGNGHDCHRVWEALLLGCVPIVQHSALDVLYQDLPIVLVDDWNEVTLEFLSKKVSGFNYDGFIMEKIYFNYWKDTIDWYQRLYRIGEFDKDNKAM